MASVVVAAETDEDAVAARTASASTTSFFMIEWPPSFALSLDHRLRSAPPVDVAGRHLARRHVDPDRPAPAWDHRADELHPHDPAGLLAELESAHVDPCPRNREALQEDKASGERLAGRHVEVEVARPGDERQLDRRLHLNADRALGTLPLSLVRRVELRREAERERTAARRLKRRHDLFGG